VGQRAQGARVGDVDDRFRRDLGHAVRIGMQRFLCKEFSASCPGATVPA
jgi:hypothetical protein